MAKPKRPSRTGKTAAAARRASIIGGAARRNAKKNRKALIPKPAPRPRVIKPVPAAKRRSQPTRSTGARRGLHRR